MSAFLDDVAEIALPVAVGLLLFAVVARGVLWAPVDDPPAKRAARSSLGPLCVATLLGLTVYVVALTGAGRASPASLVVPCLLGALAVLLRPGGAPDAAPPEPVAAAPAAAAKPAPAAEPAPPSPAPGPPAAGGSLWADPAAREPSGRQGLWSR